MAIYLLASLTIGLSALAHSTLPLPHRLKQSARESFARSDPNEAREHLAALLDVYRAAHADNPSWLGRYQWSRRLAEVAHEYLRAGEFDDALAILGGAADLDVPLRNGFENGLASVARGLHRQLEAMDRVSSRLGMCGEWMAHNRTQKGSRIYDSVVDICGPSDAYVLPDAVLAAACLEQLSLQSLGAGILEQLLENTCDADSWLNRPHESDSRLIRPFLRRATAVRKRFGDAESNLLDNAGAAQSSVWFSHRQTLGNQNATD